MEVLQLKRHRRSESRFSAHVGATRLPEVMIRGVLAELLDTRQNNGFLLSTLASQQDHRICVQGMGGN
jgi:hypothetical protein